MKIQKTMVRCVALMLSLFIAASGFSGCGYWEKKTVTASMSVKYDASDAIEQS